MSRYDTSPGLITRHETSVISIHAWNDMISSLDVDQLMQLEKLVDEVQGVESYGFEKVLTQRLSSLSVEEQEVIYSLVQEMKRGNRA